MKSLERLTMEHALVGRGLGALEIIVRRIDGGEDVPREAVQRLLNFFEVFGDRYHLEKEEHVFIPSLEGGCESGSRCDVVPAIGEAYGGHEEARRLILELWDISQGQDDKRARAAFVRHAMDYMALMRQEIAKEKDTLIRTASHTLAGEDRQLARSFRRYAERESISETSQQFAADIDEVLSELSVVVPPAQRRAYSRGTIPYHRRADQALRF